MWAHPSLLGFRYYILKRLPLGSLLFRLHALYLVTLFMPLNLNYDCYIDFLRFISLLSFSLLIPITMHMVATQYCYLIQIYLKISIFQSELPPTPNLGLLQHLLR